jgi:DNA (cytosine-5)-methyltransferase 1
MHVIELFAGAAGLAQGFERTETYETVALYDIFEPAQRTYLANCSNAKYELRNVKGLQTRTVQRALDGRILHGILGGPPCQGFSLAGKKVSENEINKLVVAYGRVVQRLHPHFLVMENVPQLLFHNLFPSLLKLLQQQYNVTYGILNAARYGVPQTRHRLFLIAYRREYRIQPTFPVPTHGKRNQLLYAYHLQDSAERVPLTEETAEDIFGADPVIARRVADQATTVSTVIRSALKSLVTVRDAIGDLGEVVDSPKKFAPYASGARTNYQRALRKGATEVANCVGRRHTRDLLQLLENLREGGTPQIFDAEGNRRFYSQAYGRLHRAGLARTLTTYFQNAGSGRFLHYTLPRTLTIREAARLQGFDDSFVFQGTLEDQMFLVGNAVPLPLAEAIGRHITSELGLHLPT